MPEKLRGLKDGYVKVDANEKRNSSLRKKKMKFYRRQCMGLVFSRWSIIAVLFLVWLIWLVWYLSSRDKTIPQEYGELHVLPMELANERGAYCLDGSPPGYYFRKGQDDGVNSWIVYLQGGGWCWNMSDCYQRSLTGFGSSKEFKQTYPFDGFLSNNKHINPDFYNWNVAYFAYCDGASFAGNADFAVDYEGNKLYFRGKRVLDLLLDYLIEQKGLAKADRIILSGVSAGGLAVYIHADYIRSKFPAVNNFHAFPDAGYFPDVVNITNFQHIRISYQRVYNLQRVENSLNKACLADKDQNTKWKCFFPQYTYHYIQTPMFILNSAYDYWTLWFILNLRCYPSLCSPKEKFHYTKYHGDFMKIAQPLLDSTVDGVYLSSCYAHSQSVCNVDWNVYLVNQTTPQQAFSDWYFHRKTVRESKYWDCTTPACNPTCDWSLEFYNNVTATLNRYDFFI
ncbi:uncharacterized protein LOC144434009 [Glandiceps talaboti]